MNFEWFLIDPCDPADTLDLAALSPTFYEYTISDTLIPITLPLATVTPSFCDFKLTYTLSEVTAGANALKNDLTGNAL